MVKKRRRFLSSLFTYFISAVIIVYSLFPLYWMVITSLRLPEEIYSPNIFVEKPTLKNYIDVITQSHYLTGLFLRQLSNSIIVALGTVCLTLSVSTLSAYALARLKFRGRRLMLRSALFTYIIPYSFLAIPFFKIMVRYGLVNSYQALIIAMATFTSPYCIWVLYGYFKSIPIEIEEAALVDGASRLRVFIGIILPISGPVLAALATYAFIFAWNELLYVLVLTGSAEMFTIPLGLMWFLISDTIPWGLLMAESIIYAIPPVIFYYSFRKYLVKGVLAGAVKG